MGASFPPPRLPGPRLGHGIPFPHSFLSCHHSRNANPRPWALFTRSMGEDLFICAKIIYDTCICWCPAYGHVNSIKMTFFDMCRKIIFVLKNGLSTDFYFYRGRNMHIFAWYTREHVQYKQKIQKNGSFVPCSLSRVKALTKEEWKHSRKRSGSARQYLYRVPRHLCQVFWPLDKAAGTC
jgi:hypothetical protein